MRSRVSKTRVYFPPIEVTGKVTLNFCTMGINGFVASKSDELTSRLVVCSMHSRFMVLLNTRKIHSKKLQSDKGQLILKCPFGVFKFFPGFLT